MTGIDIWNGCYADRVYCVVVKCWWVIVMEVVLNDDCTICHSWCHFVSHLLDAPAFGTGMWLMCANHAHQTHETNNNCCSGIFEWVEWGVWLLLLEMVSLVCYLLIKFPVGMLMPIIVKLRMLSSHHL